MFYHLTSTTIKVSMIKVHESVNYTISTHCIRVIITTFCPHNLTPACIAMYPP